MRMAPCAKTTRVSEVDLQVWFVSKLVQKVGAAQRSESKRVVHRQESRERLVGPHERIVRPILIPKLLQEEVGLQVDPVLR
jgi:hypothetical protein